MNFFKLSFRNKKEAGSIGIIGGADGPTTIHYKSDKENEREEYQSFLNYATEKIKPCERTFEELEEYLVERYRAVPHILEPHEINVIKTNVILNHFPNVLKPPMPMLENATEDQLKEYIKQSTNTILQAKEYPAEKLGLEFEAYEIQNNFRRASNKKFLRILRKSNYNNIEKNIIIEIEMKTKYLSIRNGNDEIMFDLLLYSGVSEKDIIEKSPRFIQYAYTLKHLGKL